MFEELEALGKKWDSSGAGYFFHTLVLSELGGVALETFAAAGTTDLNGTETDNTGVDSASDTVLLLNIDFGQVEVLLVKGELLFDITLGGAVDEVAHLESLDCLVLGNAS